MTPRVDSIRVLRVVVGIVGVVTMTLAAFGFVTAFRDPTLLRTDEVTYVVERLGIPVEVPMSLGLVVPMLTATVTGVFVFLRRPRDPLAMVFALMLVTLTGYTTRSLTALSSPVPQIIPLVHGISVVGFSTFFYFLLVFPGQRFAHRSHAVLWLLASTFLASRPELVQSLVTRRIDAQTSLVDRVYLATFAALFLVVMALQVVRFARAAGDERLQMKWVMLPMATVGTYVTLTILVPSVFFELSPTWFGAAMVGAIPISIAFPVCIARGVLKYRLYDIDLVINRTLVYGSLTAILAACYVGLVFSLQALLTPFTAESDLAIAGSTLAVAALFRPVRASVQSFIDRRFYRRKVDAQRTLDDFSAQLRDEVNLDALSTRLQLVVKETMQPAHVSLWLRGGP